jgi:hypothetical protein
MASLPLFHSVHESLEPTTPRKYHHASEFEPEHDYESSLQIPRRLRREKLINTGAN